MKFPARLVSVSALALVAAGCSAVNPITTSQAYDASDGMGIELGEVRGLNLLVVTEAEGAPAVLIGSFHNPTDEDVTVAASLEGDAITAIEVPAGSTVKLGGEEGEVHVTGTSTVVPGLLQDVIFQTDDAGQVVEQLPVLDGTLPEYQAELDSL